MRSSLSPRLGLSALFFLLTMLPGSLAAADRMPASCAPDLEEAASALAKGEFETAAAGFTSLATNDAAAPFVRGLALVGRAQTARAQTDTAAALATWQRLSAGSAFPQWQRDLAARRIVELERLRKGLPERDPAAYRATLPVLPAPAISLHVATNGSDAAAGSESAPFVTLQRAREAVRELKKSRGGTLPAGGVQVLVHGGTYAFNEPFRLTAEDSGTAEAPIRYQGQPGAEVLLDGGRALRDWKPVTDAAVREKLQSAVRDRVLEADLKAQGVVEWGDPTNFKQRPELFVDGVPQTLARWPNQGFVHTGEILGQDTFKVWGSIPGCRDGKFQFVEDRAKEWLDEPDVRLYGYWFWDWHEEYQRVISIDAEQRSFTLAKPYASYGYRKGQRYFAVNLFRELDEPGEWYLDRRAGKAYWLPPEGITPAKAEIVLSCYNQPFMALENVQHVLLLGLTIEEGRGDGIRIQDGSDCLVAGCTLRRLGGDAITIQGGLRHGIFGCSMHTLGGAGMQVNGGDRQKLVPGRHFVENCTVSDIARLKRTYAPAVHLDGCGNRVAHNLFERIPSSALRIEGNDHLVELNTIRHVVQESDDQGGIDMWGNPLYRGVVIRWNRWSDIVGGTECGAAGIRLDDMISGVLLQGNVFERCGAVQFGGVQIHGGKDNVVDGNVFIDCHAGFSFSTWDEPRWVKSIEPYLKQASEEPYASRYPDLARIKHGANVNVLTRNLLFACKNTFLRDGGVQNSALMLVEPQNQPPDLSAFPVQAPRLHQALFDPIPLAEIGPYAHPWKR